MKEDQKNKWIDRMLVLFFLFLLFFFVIMGLTGYAWIIVSDAKFSFWFTILTIILAVSAGAVATYSFVAYSQTRELQHLMLILLGFNIVVWSFLYLLTHPSTEAWSTTFSDRDRNRTLGMALVLIIIPVILLNSFSGEKKSNSVLTSILAGWGAIVMPIISLWFFFSPVPVFQMTTPAGGIEGLTQIGLIISVGYLIIQILAFIRFIFRWKETRNTIDLTLLLFLALLLTGTIFIIILWDPLQVAELLWIATIIAGFLLISVVQFSTSVIQPHRVLEKLVEQRTRELKLSKRESEFYLNMWSHKMGNLLQGLVSYLDILEYAAQNSEDDKKTRDKAKDLSREANILNQQVIKLSKVKESPRKVLWPVNLAEILREAVQTARELLGENSFTLEYKDFDNVIIKADDLLPLVFQSLIAFHSKNRIDDKQRFTIEIEPDENFESIIITSRGKRIPEELKLFMESDEHMDNIALDLDLFTTKLLLSRYQAKIKCARNEETSENSCILSFSK
ncbi:hypothetical protein EU527_03510 [Candidatus Thorarchaeota archaeon]|nr:MAG: hypothetical protein EU527_03510 [Candidatus Thorarchaeota archaeon]